MNETSSAKSGAASGESLANRLLKRLPGGSFAQEQLDRIERRMLRELKQRMDRLEPQASMSVVSLSIETGSATVSRAGAGGPLEPGAVLRELLAESTEQGREQAETAFFVTLLRGLVPDEARILSAVSDGSAYPLINIAAGTRLGTAMRPVLEWVSSVGKNAGVQCPELTHVYVQRLRAWGLLDIVPDDLRQTVKFEMLETDEAVRKALERIKQAGQKAYISRRLLKISDLGTRLWSACRVSED